MLRQSLILIYFSLSIGLLLSFNCEQCYYFQFILKPLLMPVLIAVAFSLYKNHNNKKEFIFLVLSLFFAGIGDILLLNDSNIFFIYGLVAFLISHILYIILFNIQNSNPLYFNKDSLLFGIVLIIYAFLFFHVIKNNLGELNIPVIFYIIIITLMVFSAFRRNKGKGYIWVLFGSICFIISDSILAYDKFCHHYTNNNYLILIFYLIAQLFIVSGQLKKINKYR